MTLRPAARIAIVHDYVTQQGGAERLVGEMVRLLPEASFHTSVIDPDQVPDTLRADAHPDDAPAAGLRARGPPDGARPRPADGVRAASTRRRRRRRLEHDRVRPPRPTAGRRGPRRLLPRAAALPVEHRRLLPRSRDDGSAGGPGARARATVRPGGRAAGSTCSSRILATRRGASARSTGGMRSSSTRRSTRPPSRRPPSRPGRSWSSRGCAATSGSTSRSRPRRGTPGRSTSSARARTRRCSGRRPARPSGSSVAGATRRSGPRWPAASRCSCPGRRTSG